MLASRSGRSAIVELLVDNGADLMATNKVLTEVFNVVLLCVINVDLM